jgi:acetyl esterase
MPGKKKATPRTQGPVLEATTAGFIDALVAAGGPPIYKMSVADARNVLDSLQSKPVAKLAAQIEDLRIPVGPTGEPSIRIIRPEKSKPCPGIRRSV